MTKIIKNQIDMRKRCKAMIDSCTNKEQMKGALNYIMLSGLGNDRVLMAWFELKLSLIGDI